MDYSITFMDKSYPPDLFEKQSRLILRQDDFDI